MDTATSSFSIRLIDWYSKRKRDLPWRNTKDPYPVWLSEIILQQTRVDQGLPYWERFMESFPSVSDLATAPENTVLRLWQGLGYYSRARNLHTTARYIHEKNNDEFPGTAKELMKLKGIGPYTAAAIASICFNEPIPVVDGNVFRFASRYFGIEIDITSSQAKKTFAEVLLNHIPLDLPGSFNQGMMEYGATVCTPVPKCVSCMFAQECFAFQKGIQRLLPTKSKKANIRERFLNYIVIRVDETLYLRQREAGDVWQGLYDFHLIEGKLEEESVLMSISEALNQIITVISISDNYKHQLSHQLIQAKFFEITLSAKLRENELQKMNLHSYSLKEVLNLPKPKLIVNYLNDLGIN